MIPTTLLRRLPAVGRLLDAPLLRDAIELYGREAVRVQAQHEIDHLRRRILESESDRNPEERALEKDVDNLVEHIADALSRRFASLRPVLNATGILIHTNLGRSPLSPEVVEEITPLLTDYCDLEVDLETGRRSERNRKVAALLTTLCQTEAALITNNNAGALILALSALAQGREVIVSRGELVEIGGSFRIPDILEASGARLREVGTTNRTHLRDYERAIGDETAILLKVHTSNYRIRGFTHAVAAHDLASLGRAHNIPVLVDEGSGLLTPDPRAPFREHESMRELLSQGCDLVCGSGDKLLGGPQAGLLLGRKDLVQACKSHPLYRALRPNRFTYATLEAILKRRLTPSPQILDRMWPESQAHRRRLRRLAAGWPGARIVEADGFIGGGSAPDEAVPGVAVAFPDPSGHLARRLRLGDPKADVVPVAGYVQDGRLLLDLRTVDPRDDERILQALQHAERAVADAGTGTAAEEGATP